MVMGSDDENRTSWYEELPLLLERETFNANTATSINDVLLWAPEHEEASFVSGGRWNIQKMLPPLMPSLGTEAGSPVRHVYERMTQMTELRLDYQRSMKPFPLAGTILLLVAIAILILSGDYYYNLTIKTAGWEDSLKKFEQTSGRQVNDTDQGRRGEGVKQAYEVLRQLTVPWENLFQAVESSTDQEIGFAGYGAGYRKTCR